MPKPTEPRPVKDCPVVTVKPSSYQPNAKELYEDLRVSSPLEKALGLSDDNSFVKRIVAEQGLLVKWIFRCPT